jgi:ATP phosphoribosyltransferase
MQKRLKIAVQKSGRLHDKSLKILNECGISIENGIEQLKATARNFPAEVLYLRNSDIPQYVQDGVADIGIIGENVVIEKQKDIDIIQKLGFSRCRLSMAVPKNTDYTDINFLNNKRIATSYPNTLKAFLKKNNLKADIHEISGSVEIAPNIGLADAICDLVSSGSTLFKNGLTEVETILRSEACITRSKNIEPEIQGILDKLMFRIQSVLAAKNTKYVLLNAPNNKIDEIIKILPGMKSPTIMPLVDKNWSSLHSVINENEFWEIIDQLKACGAQGILIAPIEKIII